MDAWKLTPAADVELCEPERWGSLKRECGLVSSALHFVFWGGVRTYFSLWHRLRLFGLENVPANPPFVLVSNHTSHLDALALTAPLPPRLRDRIFLVAAGDVFFEAPWKAACAAKLLNALPIWRRKCGPQALRHLRERLLGEPCAYALFPEGGRSRDGRMLPFKSGIGMLLAGTTVPLVPCHLDGCFEALPAGRRLPRPVRLTMRIGRPMTFESVANERAGWETVARDVREAIVRLGEAQRNAARSPFGTSRGVAESAVTG